VRSFTFTLKKTPYRDVNQNRKQPEEGSTLQRRFAFGPKTNLFKVFKVLVTEAFEIFLV